MLPEKVGLWPWVLQRGSGLFLAVALPVHLWVNPLSGYPLSVESVAVRLRFAGWLAFDLLLLAACLYHGINGLWSILLDYNPRASRRRAAAIAFLILGSVLFVYGALALHPFRRS